jgi:predicted dehydrogenase
VATVTVDTREQQHVSRTINWGIIGPGGIARQFAADLARTDGNALVAVGSRSRERSTAFARDFGVPSAHGSYEDLVADPDVDVVYVASPHAQHAEHALLAIRAGKHVLVEKPFAMSASEAESVMRDASAAGVLAMEGMWTRCNPLVIELGRRIADGAIGTPQLFSATSGAMGIQPGSRPLDASLGGSFALEVLVYPLAVMGALVPSFAEPASVHAATVRSDDGVDLVASVRFGYDGGAVAQVGGGFAVGADGSSGSAATVIGSAGWCDLDAVFAPTRARIATANGTVEELTADATTVGFGWEIEEVARTLRAGRRESGLVPDGATLATMRLLDVVRAS